MQNVDGAGSNMELLGQTKVMKIHQGAITHEICCLAAQFSILVHCVHYYGSLDVTADDPTF